jgi:hypothetical protein
MRVLHEERATLRCIRFDVILNGGEATVRDRTSAGSFDFVDGNAPDARNLQDLHDCTSTFSSL